MKKLLFAAAVGVLFLFISCSQAGTTETKSATVNMDSVMTSMAEKNMANTNSVMRGIESGDLSAMDNFVSNDIVDHGGHSGEVRGLDSVKKMLADIHNHVSNLKMTLIADASGGDYHYSTISMTGTTKDASMGMAANTPLDHTFVGVEKIVGGKVTEHWAYQDAGEMMKMMKMMTPPMHHK